MIPVVVVSSMVVCGGRRELSKSSVFASLVLSPEMLPRLRVGMSWWCIGEAYGDE